MQRIALITRAHLYASALILEGAVRYAREASPAIEVTLMLVPSAGDIQKAAVDGMILYDPPADAVQALLQRRLPAVQVLGSAAPRLHRVDVDDAEVGRLAAAHLLTRGHDRLVFVGPPDPWSTLRLEGFVAAAASADASVQAIIIESDSRLNASSRQRAIAARLFPLTPPVGVLAADDGWGLALIDACREAGVAVPDEAAVVGVNNETLRCEPANPSLTSVDTNRTHLGYEAMALLERLCRGETGLPAVVRVPPRGLVARGSTAGAAVDDPRLAAALRLMREHVCDGITVKELAASLPMSRSALEKQFRRRLGRSPGEELRRLRLEEARRLLQSTDLSLTEVAERCGFSYLSYFSRAFKSDEGITPSAYRTAWRRR